MSVNVEKLQSKLAGLITALQAQGETITVPSSNIQEQVYALLTVLFEEELPREWLLPLSAGWKIVRCSCMCGGDFAWMQPGSTSVFGCVCHTIPKGDLCEDGASAMARD